MRYRELLYLRKIEILEYLPNRKELSNCEKEIVNEELLTDKKCMNLVGGGEGGIFDDEHHMKMRLGSSKYLKEKWKDVEYKNKMTNILKSAVIQSHKDGKLKYDNFKNKKHTEATKKKMSETSKGMGCGEKNSQYGTCWITNGIDNKKINKNKLILENGWYLGRTMNKK